MLRIGVTGHRPHRLVVSERKLARRVSRVLSGLAGAMSAAGWSGSPLLDINSPLAEGTDQIVAREAMAQGQRVTALLPFSRRDYEATFDDKARVAAFRTLLNQASERLQLGGRPQQAVAGYVAVGNVTVARSDLILTIWDGKPAQGRGGTPEILQNAIGWGIPVIWIDAVRDRKPVLLPLPRSGRGTIDLFRLARRAEPLDKAAYRMLVEVFTRTA
jgi:hypothetical protein